MRLLLIPIVLLLTACAEPAPNDAAFCRPLFANEVKELESALLAHEAETPEAVGQEAADVILGHRAGCK